MHSPNIGLPKYKSTMDFHRELTRRISDELPTDQRRDVRAHYIKALTCLILAAGSYALIYFVSSAPLQILLCILSGIAHTWLGFNVFHEAIHGSLSSSKKINQAFSFITCSMLGVSRYLWQYKHNFLHHRFTNIQDVDDDLETRDALRLSPHQPQKKKYFWQHLYAPFVYAMTSLEWVYLKDHKQYFTLKLNETTKIPSLNFDQHIEYWLTKIFYYSLYTALPITIFGLGNFLIGALFFHFSHSVMMAAIFQLAHVMPDLEYPQANQENVLETDPSAHQLLTTVNFATKNPFVNWLSGGLNYQVEHHLFPQISHLHYPRLAPIVQQCAQDYGLPYHELGSYRDALKAHFSQLKFLGRQKLNEDKKEEKLLKEAPPLFQDGDGEISACR